MIRVTNVSKTWMARSGGRRAVHALSDVSLTIGDGEFVSLVGPSGCGKSTLLRMLAGLEEPDAGEIVIDGWPVTGEPGWGRGLIF